MIVCLLISWWRAFCHSFLSMQSCLPMFVSGQALFFSFLGFQLLLVKLIRPEPYWLLIFGLWGVLLGLGISYLFYANKKRKAEACEVVSERKRAWFSCIHYLAQGPPILREPRACRAYVCTHTHGSSDQTQTHSPPPLAPCMHPVCPTTTPCGKHQHATPSPPLVSAPAHPFWPTISARVGSCAAVALTRVMSNPADGHEHWPQGPAAPAGQPALLAVIHREGESGRECVCMGGWQGSVCTAMSSGACP